jgi:hypothetical protein
MGASIQLFSSYCAPVPVRLSVRCIRLIGGPALHVRAHTWLSDDMLRDDQIDDGSPGDRLGDSWLLPSPMRRTMAEDGGGRMMRAWACAWAPGMPETLAAPKVRA